MSVDQIPSTDLIFHRDGTAYTQVVELVFVTPFGSLPADYQSIFKIPADQQENHYVLATNATVFHPQGGGQPSDTGTMTSTTSPDTIFNVTAVRTAPSTIENQVLHCGTFTTSSFKPGDKLTQQIDVARRTLYSRYHTAGHVLGAAVRSLLASKVPDFDELKASHDPVSAACEFQGLIDGAHRERIQARVDELVAQNAEVEIEWWTADDFEANGAAHQRPAGPPPGGEAEGKWRVVRIRGVEVYPCGGTHVASTSACGKTSVTKIKRQKGTSRVSYKLDA